MIIQRSWSRAKSRQAVTDLVADAAAFHTRANSADYLQIAKDRRAGDCAAG
jgi:hypothetical protein